MEGKEGWEKLVRCQPKRKRERGRVTSSRSKQGGMERSGGGSGLPCDGKERGRGACSRWFPVDRSRGSCGGGLYGEETQHVGRLFGPDLMNSTIFKLNRILSKETSIDLTKDALPLLKKILIRYDFIENEIRNNFPYWNVLKFGIEFELKFKEAIGFEIQ
jgi:hypothetical protein